MSKKVLDDNDLFDLLLNDADLSDIEGFSDEEDTELENLFQETADALNRLGSEEEELHYEEEEKEIMEVANEVRLKWEKGSYNPVIADFIPLEEEPIISIKTPYQYFKLFVTDEMITEAVIQTNIYSIQKSGNSIEFTKEEFEKLLGMYLKMGIAQLPSVRAYWEDGIAYIPVSEVMPRNRFMKLLSTLHFKNNLEVNEIDKKNDKIWKLRPWLESFWQNCLSVAPEEHHSVDEMMVAFKGRSFLRQFMPMKPTRWGFKIWGRAGSSGFLYDFDIYQGAKQKTDRSKKAPGKGLSYETVMLLTSTLPEKHNFKVFADNFFTTDILPQSLLSRNIYFLGTVRSNRLNNPQLASDKMLASQGRGSSDFSVDHSKKYVTVRWYDNKSVTLLSSYAGVEPQDQVQRWQRSSRTHVQTPRPLCIAEYNKFMGGIDLLDSLTSLYKYNFRSKRWYMYLFWQSITFATVNAWLLMRREVSKFSSEKRKYIPLRQFQKDIASSLVLVGKQAASKRKRGRPNESLPPCTPKCRRSTLPTIDVQTDGIGHWPVWETKRGRCKICINNVSFVKCEKCEIFLCFNKDRNCFRRFHIP